MKLYTQKKVNAMLAAVRGEQEEALRHRAEAEEDLKAENRTLRARVSELEAERASVAEALVRAAEEGERIRREAEESAESGRRELGLLAEKCRLLLDMLTEKYPDGEDVADFAAFNEALRAYLNGDAPSAVTDALWRFGAAEEGE